MKTFDVYPRFDINLVRGKGCQVFDEKGRSYLDFYGGHAVISIGHSNFHYQKRIKEQLDQIGFYSNSVNMPIQEELANKLGVISGYPDYSLFLCNSGAEANENAMKLASFHTGRKKFIVFTEGFHGRTSLAVGATDNPKILAPVNETSNFIRISWGDIGELKKTMSKEVAGVLIEGIQGIGGIQVADAGFLEEVKELCDHYGSLLILDEIQSGYGRSGRFFAHQYDQVNPDIITVAKGMGNGFPIGGVLISPAFRSWPGMLGTTFGGNHLACAAGLAVLEEIEYGNLIKHASDVGSFLINELKHVDGITDVRGKGLMIGVDLPTEAKEIRKSLLFDHGIFTGSAKDPKTIRLLPPLTIEKSHIKQFLGAFKQVIQNESVSLS